MQISGIVDPEQLAILPTVLEEICAAAGIESDSAEREDAACHLMRLYWNGYHTAEGLRSAFAAQVDQEKERYG